MTPPTTGFRFVYITAPNDDEAATIARALVQERLAACANILPGARSIYRWQGKIADDSETVCVLKSHVDRLPKLIERAQQLHSYDVPCVVAMPITDISEDYADWLSVELDLHDAER